VVDRRVRQRRRVVPHPDVHDQDAFLTPPGLRGLVMPRDDAAVDFVEMTPLIERMRIAFFS
jgi:hypothetical protein